jgi:hypothetical protein
MYTEQLFQIRIPNVGPNKRGYVGRSMPPSIVVQNSKANVVQTLKPTFGKCLKGVANAIILLFTVYL